MAKLLRIFSWYLIAEKYLKICEQLIQFFNQDEIGELGYLTIIIKNC